MCQSRVWTYAASFLVYLCCSCIVARAEEQLMTDPVEVKALHAIKKSLIDPNKHFRHWRGDPCISNWMGIHCYNTTLYDGYLHVEELQLLKLNLSGSLSPELGHLPHLLILDVMWNNISGSIPKEIGNITSLKLLLLNGNQLEGPLPEELGNLPNLDRLQIDQNQISGPIPKSFAKLIKAKHFHMNNNSISGQIPPELSELPNLIHLLLDNNNMSGYLPSEFSSMPSLHILQLDNNRFDGTIPASYSNMSKLLKLSLRNCSLRGPIPDLSKIPNLYYLDLSSNELTGPIPKDRFSANITTIDLSDNKLNGTIPSNFSGLPNLQKLSFANNILTGSVPSDIWSNVTLNETETLDLDFRNNELFNISGSIILPPNVSLWLGGNPVCSTANMIRFCGNRSDDGDNSLNSSDNTCRPQSCPSPFEYSITSPVPCFCAAPLLIGYRLKSPGFSNFLPYKSSFIEHLTYGLGLEYYQMDINSFVWVRGPRLQMYLKLFPVFRNGRNDSHIFNRSEVLRIRRLFSRWTLPDSDLFGPYELLNFTLLEPYKDVIPTSSTSGLSKGALAGIVLGAIAVAVTLSAVVALLITGARMNDYRVLSRKHRSSKSSIKIDGVKAFSYKELALATNNFDISIQVGQGGYGKVYKGNLADGAIVAIKRAQEGSLQGEKEFLTEIQLLSRLHHRNLVSLIGYCDEEGEQMLVYEFMSNGTLRDHLSAKYKDPLSFIMRLRIALGAAKGILYLHTEADPPIFHRDIKASNILLDSKLTAKVADFGLSRLAPVPDVEGVLPAHISTVVKGTPGYLDPEYFLTHKLTDKSDVYSLGVVLLELLTGMHPISRGKNIVREVKIAYHSGQISTVIDEKMGSYPSECTEQFATLALRCCQDETDGRPSMAEVVRELEQIWLMTADSDTNMTESTVSGSSKVGIPLSSTLNNPYLSVDVSGSNLESGVTPSVTPR